MKCTRIQSELCMNFGTDPDQALQKHMSACPQCKELDQELAALSACCESLPAYSPSEQVWDKIEQEIEQANARVILDEMHKARPRPLFKWWAGAAAAVVILAAAVLLTLLSTNPNTDTTGSGTARNTGPGRNRSIIYRPQYQPAAVKEETVFMIPIEGNIILLRREEESDSGYENKTFSF